MVAGMLPLVLAGCASLGRTTPYAAGVADTVYYLSARARVDGRDSRGLAPGVEQGLVVMRRHVGSPDDRAVQRDIVDSVVLDSLTFIQRLRERLGRQLAPFDFAVLYVHGMGTSLHEAWRHTAAARSQAGRDVPWIVFCWPAGGGALSWPQRDALLTAAYHRDSLMADSAGAHFTRSLRIVGEAVPHSQLVVASHSLGGQLVSGVLAGDSAVRHELRTLPLRALAFVMPDVELQQFRTTIAPAMTSLAGRRVLYVARNDRALMIARHTRGTERAGLRADSGWTPPDTADTETVDVTNAISTEGWFQRHFGTHHAIKRKTGVLMDLVQVVGSRRDARCRQYAGWGVWDDGLWVLQRTPGSADGLSACTRDDRVER